MGLTHLAVFESRGFDGVGLSRRWGLRVENVGLLSNGPLLFLLSADKGQQSATEDKGGPNGARRAQRSSKDDQDRPKAVGEARSSNKDSRPHKTTKVEQERWPQDKGRERRASGHAKGRKSTKEFRAKERTTLHNRGQEDKGQQRDTRKDRGRQKPNRGRQERTKVNTMGYAKGQRLAPAGDALYDKGSTFPLKRFLKDGVP